MDATALNKWIAENGTGHRERKYINGISYLYAEMKDGWVAIFECDNGNYLPKIQAKNTDKADAWCGMHERPRVPFNVF